MTFWSVNIVRGRKPHRCASCCADMPIGTLHYACAGKHDGDFHAYRHCIGCFDLGSMVFNETREAYQVDELGETAAYYLGDDAPEVLAFKARSKWHAAQRRAHLTQEQQR